MRAPLIIAALTLGLLGLAVVACDAAMRRRFDAAMLNAQEAAARKG